MEAEEFIKIYEYLKNEHEEEMAERYEEVMDVQYGIKSILEELQEITAQLLACGASITEINTIRKHLSQVKGVDLLSCVSLLTLIPSSYQM